MTANHTAPSPDAPRQTCNGCKYVVMDYYPNGQERPLCYHPTQIVGELGSVATTSDGKPPSWCPLNK